MHGCQILCTAFKDPQTKKVQGLTNNTIKELRSVSVCIESRAAKDRQSPEYREFESVGEARKFVMHPTVPKFPKSISRYRLSREVNQKYSLLTNKSSQITPFHMVFHVNGLFSAGSSLHSLKRRKYRWILRKSR